MGFLNGLFQAFPIVIGYLAIGTPFGLIATKMGIPIWAVLLMSVMVYAGSAQFVAVQLILAGSNILSIVLATLILNLRHALMCISLGSSLPKLKLPFLLLFSHTVTDESYGVNMAKIKEEEYLNPMNALGTNLMAYFSWILATLLGAYIGALVPIDLKYLAGALPIMFVALMSTQLKDRKHVLFALLAAVLTLLLMSVLPGKWPFLLTAIGVPTIATFYELQRIS